MSKSITQCIISASAGRLWSLPRAGCHSPGPEVTEDECPLPHCHLYEGHLGQVVLPGARGTEEGQKGHGAVVLP